MPLLTRRLSVSRRQRAAVAAASVAALIGAGLAPALATTASAVSPSSAKAAVNPCLDSKSVTATNDTDVAIPLPAGVITSDIVVSGAPKVIDDVDVITQIAHSATGELTFTVTSPKGTIVTLSSRNGDANDNIFYNTRWDDSADGGAALPALSNFIATQMPFTNGVSNATVVPEEPLGAFVGENPNGTWTISVADATTGDGGSLDGWTLDIDGRAAAPVLTSPAEFVATPAMAITDNNMLNSYTVDVSGVGTKLYDVDVLTNISHMFNQDLDFTVRSPAGTNIYLSTNNGGVNDNVFAGTRWDDSANPGGAVPYTSNPGLVTDNVYANLTTATTLTPEEGLAALKGQDPNGTWTLTVIDVSPGDTGTLNSWGVDITTEACDVAVNGFTATSPASVKLKKKAKALTIASKVTGAEPLAVLATGTVKVAGTKGLLPLKKAVVKTGASATTLKQVLDGSKGQIKKRLTTIRKALKKKKKVTASLTFVAFDALGNTQTIKKTVTIK